MLDEFTQVVRSHYHNKCDHTVAVRCCRVCDGPVRKASIGLWAADQRLLGHRGSAMDRGMGFLVAKGAQRRNTEERLVLD